MVAYISAGILGVVVLILFIRKNITKLSWSPDRSLIKYIFIQSWPIGIVALFGTILASIDTVILGWLRTTTEVGYYAAAQKPLQVLWLLPGLMTTALLPFFSKISNGEQKKFESILGRAITIALAAITPLVGICILFARPIISILFGSTYIAAVPLLQIIAISAIATIPSLFISNALLAKGKQKTTLLFIIIGASTNVILSFILIPAYGMYGAALSYTLSQIISNIFIVYKTRSIPGLKFQLSLRTLKSDIQSFLYR